MLGLLLSVTYRPYVYKNNINDFGFADVIDSLVSIIAFCTFFWSQGEYSNKIKNLHIVLAVIIYGIIWESLGYFGLYGTFDGNTIMAYKIVQ